MENAIALTITRELGEHDVPVHGVARDASAIAVASRHCRGWTRRPDGLIASWLPDLIARTGARAVLAIAESDLMELATMPPMANRQPSLVMQLMMVSGSLINLKAKLMGKVTSLNSMMTAA